MNSSSLSSMDDVYELRIWLDPNHISQGLISKYNTSILAHNKKVTSRGVNGSSCADAGIDLYIPNTIDVEMHTHSNKINHYVKAAMFWKGIPTAYYLYPRSSMGSKTPLRMANSVGIIDAGYRGNLIGVVDNLSDTAYSVNTGDRLMQICAPNLTYPIYATFVSSLSELGETERGDGGFGSTGM